MKRPLTVLLVHARYQQAGGEDAVVARESRLLAEAGHIVAMVEARNDSIVGLGGSIAAGLSAIYSPASKRQVSRAIASHAPDVVHVHNFFPLLSPSVFDACQESRVPVVHTLHNYRLACPNALLFRDGHTCEECVGRAVPWPAIRHGCYRGSRLASAAPATMLAIHRQLGTFRRSVDAYIVLSRFQRDIVVRSGLPQEKVFIKPTGVPDRGCSATRGPGSYGLYVGRLAPEKGVATLIAAYDRLGPTAPLYVIGDGPVRAELERLTRRHHAADRITFLGQLQSGDVANWMRGARFLVFPSECYETQGLTLTEAAACGRPAVASRVGAVPEIVTDGATGWLVPPGDPVSWRRAIETAWASPDEGLRRGNAARALYEERFSEPASLARLLRIYDALVAPAASR